jgi:hypothetical protein
MGSCHLCTYLGSDHPVFDEIMCYVTDNAHCMYINELATHVQNTLQQHLQIDMTQEQIHHHFLAHQCEQKLVLNHVLLDLLISSASPSTSALS